MNLTRTTTLRVVKIVIVVILVCTVIGYATWRSLDYFLGPTITIFEPADGSSVATSTIIIKGQVERINTILLNGNPISIDEQGNFGQIMAVFPGLNILTFNASDQFGRSTQKKLSIFGTVDLPAPTFVKPSNVIATSTSTSTP